MRHLYFFFTLFFFFTTVTTSLSTTVFPPTDPATLSLSDDETNACTLLPPSNLRVVATTNSARLTWNPSTNATQYHARIVDLNQTTDTPVYEGNVPATTFTATGLQQEHNYQVTIHAICANGTISQEASFVSFTTIVIEDVVYLAAPGCGMTNCDCTIGTNYYDTNMLNSETKSKNWLNASDRQVLLFTINSKANSNKYAKFKVSKETCDNNVYIRKCDTATYEINIVGKDYVRIDSSGIGGQVCKVTFASDKFSVIAYDSIHVNVKLCDTCNYCQALLPPGGGSPSLLASPGNDGSVLATDIVQIFAGPNPFVDHLTVSYQLPADGDVSLFLYDWTGKEISRLVDRETQTAGSHQVAYYDSNLASGLYYLVIRQAEQTATLKVIRQ